MSYSSLITKNVVVRVGNRVFNGPIIDTGDDFVVLDDESVGPVILAIWHVQSIQCSEYPKHVNGRRDQMNTSLGHLETLQGRFCNLKHSVVQTEGGGLVDITAFILEVKNDYVAFCVVPDGVMFIPIRHIRVLVPIEEVELQPAFAAWVAQHTQNTVYPEYFRQLIELNLGEVVTLSRNTPDEVTGLLSSCDDQEVRLTSATNATTFVPLHHIKNVSSLRMSTWTPEEQNIDFAKS